MIALEPPPGTDVPVSTLANGHAPNQPPTTSHQPRATALASSRSCTTTRSNLRHHAPPCTPQIASPQAELRRSLSTVEYASAALTSAGGTRRRITPRRVSSLASHGKGEGSRRRSAYRPSRAGWAELRERAVRPPPRGGVRRTNASCTRHSTSPEAGRESHA